MSDEFGEALVYVMCSIAVQSKTKNSNYLFSLLQEREREWERADKCACLMLYNAVYFRGFGVSTKVWIDDATRSHLKNQYRNVSNSTSTGKYIYFGIFFLSIHRFTRCELFSHNVFFFSRRFVLLPLLLLLGFLFALAMIRFGFLWNRSMGNVCQPIATLRVQLRTAISWVTRYATIRMWCFPFCFQRVVWFASLLPLSSIEYEWKWPT